MTKLLSGKEVAAALQQDLQVRVKALQNAGVQPTLALVRVGAQPGDLSYERGISKRAEALGVQIRSIVLPEDVSQAEMERAIDKVNEDEGIHGCLMFRPLPKHLDEEALCQRIALEKDVDGVSKASLAEVFCGTAAGFAPSTAVACLKILDHYGIDVAGKRVTVVGRSLVIGKPVAIMLLDRNATVSVCHSKTPDLAEAMRWADVVVCATGRAKAYGAESFREGQVLLDVGINVDENGKLCGDVDAAAIEDLVAAYTPVPGGVGSVTSLVTLEHAVKAAQAKLA